MNGPGRGRPGGHVRWEVWGVQSEGMGSSLSRSGSEISKSKGQRWPGMGGRVAGPLREMGWGLLTELRLHPPCDLVVFTQKDMTTYTPTKVRTGMPPGLTWGRNPNAQQQVNA